MTTPPNQALPFRQAQGPEWIEAQRTRLRVTAEAVVHGTSGGRCLSGEPASTAAFSPTTQVPRHSGMSLSLGSLGVASHS
jgi:hypothetical protein